MERSRYMDMSFMSQFGCADVWGIGRRISEKLSKSGVRTAADFIRKDEMWVKKTFGIMTLYTSWELKGHRAHELEAYRKPPKSIMVSRSFGNPITEYEDMLDPLLCFTVSAGRQLRKAGQTAGKMSVFISTNRFDREKYYANGRETSFRKYLYQAANIKGAASSSPIFPIYRRAGKPPSLKSRQKRKRNSGCRQPLTR